MLAFGEVLQSPSVVDWYSVPRKKEKVYPRECFACGTEMTLMKDCSFTLECKECDIQENGTLRGRFHMPMYDYEWDGETVTFIDHSKVYMPSPDVTPLAHHAAEG